MSFTVEWTKSARKQLSRIQPRQQRERIVDAVEVFAETGRGDIRKLQGFEDEYRLRIGEYRVRFRVDVQVYILTVLRVFPRGDGY